MVKTTILVIVIIIILVIVLVIVISLVIVIGNDKHDPTSGTVNATTKWIIESIQHSQNEQCKQSIHLQ